MKIRTTLAVCLCLGALVPLACGTTVEVDGSGGATSDGDSGGSSSGGADSSGGASSGGESSGGAAVGGTGLGGAFGGADTGGSSMGGGAGLGGGSCSEELGGEEFCAASLEQYQRCTDPDAGNALEQCMMDDALFDRFDPCVVQALIGCFSLCEPTVCMQEAVVEVHPELFNEEVFVPCLQNPEPVGVDCSDDNLAEGKQQECLDRADECGVHPGNCVNANLVREEFLPERDACLEGPCDEIVQCLYDVAYGPTP